jgi:VanZ family protein
MKLSGGVWLKNSLSFRIGLFGWSLLTCFLSLTPRPAGVILEQGWDKVFHLAFYFPLGVLAYFHPRPGIKPVFLVACFGLNLGFLLELLQRRVPGRGFDYHDFFADALGVILGLLFTGLIRRGKWGQSQS